MADLVARGPRGAVVLLPGQHTTSLPKATNMQCSAIHCKLYTDWIQPVLLHLTSNYTKRTAKCTPHIAHYTPSRYTRPDKHLFVCVYLDDQIDWLHATNCKLYTADCTLHTALHGPLHLVFLPCLLPSSSSCSSLVKAESIVSRSSPKSWYSTLLIGSDWIVTVFCYKIRLDSYSQLLLAVIVLPHYSWLFFHLPGICPFRGRKVKKTHQDRVTFSASCASFGGNIS